MGLQGRRLCGLSGNGGHHGRDVDLYILATVPPRSQAIEDAVRDAAGATVTDTVMATVTVETFVQPAGLVQIPAPLETAAAVPAPVQPAVPEMVNPGSFCDVPSAAAVPDSDTQMVCTTTAEDDRDRWRSAG